VQGIVARLRCQSKRDFLAKIGYHLKIAVHHSPSRDRIAPMAVGPSPSDPMKFSALWRENHGNFLLFVAMLIIVGGGIAMVIPRKPEPSPLLFPDASRDRMLDVAEDGLENGSTDASDNEGQINAGDIFSSEIGPTDVLDKNTLC
jgi:hypothetical protein